MSSAIPTSASSAAAATASGGSVVTSTGIGSGLDINSIVSSLTTAEGAAQNNQLAAQKTALTAQISAYGTFSSALSTLQATLTPLETTSSLAGRTATLGDTTVATASVTADAVPAQYSLGVQNLATAASLSSVANPTLGTGTLMISVGGQSSSVTIDSTNDTLSGIASAINSAPDNPGVTATILTTTAGARLVLSGSATGASNAITVTQSGGNGGLASLTYNPASGTTASTTGLTETQAALDANFTLNGYPATSASNQVTGAITGVTLNLLKPTTAGSPAVDTPTTLTIGNDTTGAQTSIGTFVKALNGLVTAIQTLTAYDPSTKTAGPLQGNATLQSFQNQLQKLLGQVQSGNSGSLNSLAALGITANPDGSYSADTTKIGNALTASVSSVAALLGGTNGIATQLNALVNQYSGTGGLLGTITNSLQSGLKDNATQQAALNARLSTYSATITAQYNAMDTAVALLKQTQTFLTAQFNASSSSSSGTSANTGLGSGTLSTG